MTAAMDIFKKILRVKGILDEMAENKEDRIRELVGLPPQETWWEQCKEAMCESFRACCCRTFCPCCIELPTLGECCCPKGSFCFRLCTMGEYLHEVVKTFLFFLLGLLVSMGIFFFFCLQLEVNMELALVIAVFTGLFLSIGLAFFNTVRCITLLALPNFCSSKGRSFLIMYAMVLIMNHPVQNFSHNLEVLSDAATCGQSLVLNETKELVETAAAPIVTVLGGMKIMLKHIKRLAEELKKAFKALVRAVEEIVATIGRVFSWLANMTDVCNERLGAPYRKCKKVFEDGYGKCKSKLWLFGFLCSVVRLVGKVCYLARIGELLCVIVDAVKKLILEKVGPPVMSKIHDIKEMFDFNVTLEYRFVYNMNQSRPYSEVRQAIMTEVREKLSIIHVFQTIVDNTVFLTVIMVVVKAILYRRKFLNKDGFDNMYLTRRLFQIEGRRAEQDKDTIFPLKAKDKLRFIKTFTYQMNIKEWKRLLKGLLFWGFAFFHATYYIVCDYGLYWILDLVRRKMGFSSSVAMPPHLQLHVQGHGPMADMYKSMVGVLEPVADAGLDIDSVKCLPNPREPNWGVYRTVYRVMGLVFLLTVFQAYLLRMQHVVCNMYYPHRERKRACWLYNYILTTRDTFLEFTRKQIQRKFMNGKQQEKYSLINRLSRTSKLCNACLKCLGRRRKYCMSCAQEGPQEDMVHFTHCTNCKSPYCNECFAMLKKVCTACMHPLDYGDEEGISIESDSSEEEQDKRLRVASIKDRKQKIQHKKEEKDPKKWLASFHKKFIPTGAKNVGTLGEDSETGEDGSTKSYDTDYQHRSEDTSDDESSLLNRRKKKKTDKVSTDIFSSSESD